MNFINGRVYIYICTIISILLLAKVHAEITDQEKINCANKLINWCEKVVYEKYNYEHSVVSFTDPTASKHSLITCTKDYGGITCIKSGIPLFYCSRDNKLFYKGVQLQKDSSKDVDNEICFAESIPNEMYQEFQKSMAKLKVKMDNLHNDLSTKFKKEKERFDQQMSELHERLSSMNKRLSRPCFPFCTY